MARRSMWNGAISFGMVAIPIKLYPATESKDISFVTLHSTCNTRIRQQRYCPHHDTTVELSEIVKGYEYAKDQYVVMEESDFENLPVPSKHAIEIVKFVDLESIDPIFFERGYSLEPQDIGVKPYYLLKRALESTRRVAVAQVSLRNKEELCLLRPYEQGIMLETMRYPDEIRGMKELNLPEDEASLTDAEVSMAVALIDQLSGSFDAGEYHDAYRSVLEQVIEAKLSGSEPVTAAPAAAQGQVGDLMEALKASIEATKARRAVENGEPAKADGAEAPAGEEKAAPARKARGRSKAKV